MSNIEFLVVKQFLAKKGAEPGNIQERLDVVYYDSSPSISTIKHKSKLIRWGENIENDLHQGRSVSVTIPENVA